jgi:hypothetical protein
VEESTPYDDWIQRASARLVLYAAMLGATLAGQAIGIAADAAAGMRALWVPAIASVVLEAIAGARAGAARAGRPLTASECLRVSVTYSLGFVAVTLPLAVWTIASARGGQAPVGAGSAWTLGDAGRFVAAAVVATLARAGLMRAFSPARRP